MGSIVETYCHKIPLLGLRLINIPPRLMDLPIRANSGIAIAVC